MIKLPGCSSAWLERYVRDVEAAGSNPVTPIDFVNKDKGKQLHVVLPGLLKKNAGSQVGLSNSTGSFLERLSMSSSAPYWWEAKKGWYCYFTSHDGKRQRKLLGKTKAEALRVWKESLASSKPNRPDKPFSIVANEWLLRQKSRLVKGDVSAVWLARSARTVDSFTKKFPKVKCGSITEVLVTEWLGTHASLAYERTEVGTIKQILRWAKIDAPVLSMKLSKGNSRDVVLSLAQHHVLVNATKSKQFKVLLQFAWWTGARPSELRALQWEHIKDDFSRAVMTKHKTSKKTHRPRVIYFNREAQAALRELHELRSAGHVFLNCRNEPYSKCAIVKRMDLLRDATGIRVTAYAYRHSFATRALLAGETMSTVAELLGTSVDMISRVYGHLDQAKAHLTEAANRI